ncbi:MAG: imidazole glycerol phosphate synthase subunit HisH [Chlamydiae bacterium]|nr:imidazole glycerol phosphate synthase subunit HisH [Chlamydiota bacterium]MBI3277530.1 imidazole glycerol phosphate synthase subunit HisH [Chlamydiota bacterium]
MITIIDYEMGNLGSVAKAFQFLGVECEVTQDPKRVVQADKIVFPGVGAFEDCIANLKKKGLDQAILQAINSEKPFLGICLGLQALFEKSEEGGAHPGLGILKGPVVKFHVNLKVPHMGWNQIIFSSGKTKNCPLLKGVSEGSYVYFIHSYYGVPEDKTVIVAQTDYEVRFASMVWKDHLFATQFHPEKSQKVGLRMLKNFAEL